MYKLTFYMSTDDYTWSETWYTNTPSPGTILPNFKFLVEGRANLLAAGAGIAAVRQINMALPRNSFYPDISGFVTQGSGNWESLTNVYADRPYSSVLARFTDNAGYTKTSYFSGAPDLMIGQAPTEFRGIEAGPLFTTWQQTLSSFTSYLSGLGLGWLRQQWTGLGTPIQAVLPPASPANQIQIQTATPLVFTGKPQLVIRGFRRVAPRYPGLNGKWYVNPASPGLQSGAVAPFTYWLVGTPLTSGQATNWTGQGYCTAVSMTISQVQNGGLVPTSYDIIGATHRKRGSTELSPRGRSRTR